jgi:hypothetical protein
MIKSIHPHPTMSEAVKPQQQLSGGDSHITNPGVRNASGRFKKTAIGGRFYIMVTRIKTLSRGRYLFRSFWYSVMQCSDP